MLTMTKLEDALSLIKNNDFVLLYISSQGCNVCKSLFPKIETILKNFPKISSGFIEIDSIQEAAGEFSVFSVPVLLLFVEGKETIRESRYISLNEFEEKIRKYYSLFY